MLLSGGKDRQQVVVDPPIQIGPVEACGVDVEWVRVIVDGGIAPVAPALHVDFARAELLERLVGVFRARETFQPHPTNADLGDKSLVDVLPERFVIWCPEHLGGRFPVTDGLEMLSGVERDRHGGMRPDRPKPHGPGRRQQQSADARKHEAQPTSDHWHAGRAFSAASTASPSFLEIIRLQPRS